MSENSDTEEAIREDGNTNPESKAHAKATGMNTLNFIGGGYLQNAALYYPASNLLHEQDKE